MEPVRSVEWVFFPLDEQLGLTSSSLTPKYEQHLVHLAAWMPFSHAAAMLATLVGVQVSEATVRRHTEQAGAVCEALQNAAGQPTSVPSPEETPRRLALSADGAFVSLVKGVWSEVRTLAIGEVPETGNQARTRNLSYFSRMTDAASFAALIQAETNHRHLSDASQVAGVLDGADWLQGLLDLHRPDALRILDFPHAAQRISALFETVQQAGTVLPLDALTRSLHLLKHRGPRPVLRWLRHLTRTHLDKARVREDLAYLHKREPLMHYPRYQTEGWPIGSGMVESANKVVMQARLKGPGMHWEPTHVNPMLALRTTVCNDRWHDTWEHITSQRRRQRQQERIDQTRKRQQQATIVFLRAWMRFLLSVNGTPPPAPVPRPASIVAGRPTAHHPWKRGPACPPKLSAKK